MKYKTFAKNFKTLKAAENYLNSLYSKYNYAKLIDWPKFSENGLYVFTVGN